jgi:uncharacterized membrane protein
MEKSAATATGRLEFLDLVRGVFLLVMVEGHTLRALLDPAIKSTAAFQYHELIHNLPGPAFLFASGVAFVYSTRAQWDSYRRWGPKLRRRLSRWLAVLAIGYGLQLTYATLRRTLSETTPEQFAFLVSLNILQCICLSLILLQVLAMVVPEMKWFFNVAALGSIVIAFATPFAWDIGREWPVWLASLVSGRTRSAFPLFPYAGFALAGAAWGYQHALARERDEEAAFLRRSAWFCVWLCLGSVAVALAPLPQIYSDFWYTSPLFFFLRVGILGLLTIGARHAETRLMPRFRELLAIIGKESLLIYVVHLIVLYGSAFNPDTNLVKVAGRAQPLAESLLIWLIFTAAMVLLGVWWSWWKRGREWEVRGAKWMLAGYFAYRSFFS